MNSIGSYDKNSVESIYDYAMTLTNKSLAEVVDLPSGIVNNRDRGNLGSLVEIYFFQHKAPNDHNPDFLGAGLELKTTGVKRSTTGGFRAKERLVLGMIDFQKIATENWDTSAFVHKCRTMLILFNNFEKQKSVIDRKFVLKPYIFQLNPITDKIKRNRFPSIPVGELETIKKDWEFIRQKIVDGKAHELSEGDTIYLGACRKGAGGDSEPLKSQPNSVEKAKARAFSLKQGYVNRLIERLEGEIVNEGFFEHLPFEEAIRESFAPFIGKSVLDLGITFDNLKINKNQKGYYRNLALDMLNTSGSSIPELKEADIELKTIRLNRNGKPREAMSFPTFDYLEIEKESWEDSKFFEKIESKFLFILFQEAEDKVERFIGAKLWNMPFEDREEAKRVWENTKHWVSIDAKNLPKSSESFVAHVRPKAANSTDTALTPQGEYLVKKCFWLNKNYIADVVSKLFI